WSRIEAAVAPGSSIAASHGGVWQNLSFWRWTAIGSFSVAVASLLALVYIAGTSTQEQPLIARLDMGGDRAGFVAAIDPAHNGLTIVPASVTNVNQRVLELWLIAPGNPPRSLGLIDPGRAVHINLPPDLIRRVSADATLAVSVEPP